MKSLFQKTFVLAIGIFIMLTAGCEEENLPDTKMSRLIAVENRQLKKQLEQRNKEIEKQKKLLEKCLQQKKAWKTRSDKNIRKQIEPVLGVVMEKNAKLQKEIEELNKIVKMASLASKLSLGVIAGGQFDNRRLKRLSDTGAIEEFVFGRMILGQSLLNGYRSAFQDIRSSIF